MEEIISNTAQDRLLELISREHLPQDVRSTLAHAITGDLRSQQLMFQAMIDTWGRLQKAISEVSNEVVSASWQVTPHAKKGDEPSPSALEKAAFIEEALWKTSPNRSRNELDFTRLIEGIVHGFYMGHHVVEIFWHKTQEGVIPRAYKHVPSRFYGYPIAQEDDALMLCQSGDFSPYNLTPFPENQFITIINSGHVGHPSVGAPLRALTGFWLASHFGLKWLLNFSQLFGIPFRWAEYSDDHVKDKVCSMLKNIGSSGWGAFPAGTKINFEETHRSAGDLPQKVLIEMADKQCDIFILGQSLTTDVGDSGSRALGDVHETVRKGVLRKIGNFVAEAINHQVIAPLLKLNYGALEEAPVLQAVFEQHEDPQELAQRDKILFEMGIPLDKGWFYQRHNLPMPEDEDDMLGGSPKKGDSIHASRIHAYNPSQKRAPKGNPHGGRWIKEDDTESSEALDKAYFQALGNGDEKQARALVESAARKAGYNLQVYHGTQSRIEAFDPDKIGSNGRSEGAGFYTTPNKDEASTYTTLRDGEGEVISAFIRKERYVDGDQLIPSEEQVESIIERAIRHGWKENKSDYDSLEDYLSDARMDASYYTYRGESIKGMQGDFFASGALGRASLNKAIAEVMGIDGFKNKGYDNAGRSSLDIYVSLESRFIKKSDTTTYDSKGEVIPLSKRFNVKENRISFAHAGGRREESKPSMQKLLDSALESLTGVQAQWLGGVKAPFLRLGALAQSGEVSDADFLEALEKAQRDLPELFDGLRVEALEEAFNKAIGSGLLSGSVSYYE